MSNAVPSELSNKGEYTRAMSTTDVHGLKDVWRDMVEKYTNLDLTFTSDRFAAIAGVAKQMQEYRRANYFAGLWEDFMIGDMLWKSFPSPGDQMKPRKEGNSAPTWSWASVEAPWITYDHLGTCLGARGRPAPFERIEDTYVKILGITLEGDMSMDGQPAAAVGISLSFPEVQSLNKSQGRALGHPDGPSVEKDTVAFRVLRE